MMVSSHTDIPTDIPTTSAAGAQVGAQTSAQADTQADSQTADRASGATRRRGPTVFGVSLPWLAVYALMICFIWGNSLVPGEESGSMSMAVVETIRAALGALGLPYGWVTDFIVRKTAHFTEYMVLGLVGMQAFRPHRSPVRAGRIALAALAILAVPCLDETIQLFVSGRAGQVTDVLIDCSGAATGALLTLLVSRLHARGRE